MKSIFIGKGFLHFKEEQNLKWKEIKNLLEYQETSTAQGISYKKSCNTTLVEKLANAFGVTPSEFIKQCEVEEVKK